MNGLSLFSGIGGGDLAAHWAGIKTVAFCEQATFPQKVLKKHWPEVPIYDDVCTLTKERLEADGIGTIDLIHGGFPCQPFSAAGQKKGRDDDRDLWPEMFRIIREIKPTWVVGENVANFVNMELERTLTDLESEGYETQAFLIPACGVDAKHQRFRVFVVAHANSNRQWPRYGFQQSEGDTARECTSNSRVVERVGLMANASSIGQSGSREPFQPSDKKKSGIGKTSQPLDVRIREEWTAEPRLGGVLDGISDRVVGHRWPVGPGQPQHDWEPHRVKLGVKNRKDKLKSLGNAIVPQQIYPFFAAIMQIEAMNIR